MPNDLCIYAAKSSVNNVANYALLRCKICGLEIRQCKKNDKYHVWSRRGCFAKAKFGFLLSIPLHSSVFGTSFQLITVITVEFP